MFPARLACVKHAASVRPEPGSNSDVQSLTSTHWLPISTRQSAYLPSFRQSVSLIKNLTVDTIVAPSGAPVSSFLYKMTFLCIVFKDRCCRFVQLVCCSRDNVDDYSKDQPFCQHFFWRNFQPFKILQNHCAATLFSFPSPIFSQFSFVKKKIFRIFPR